MIIGRTQIQGACIGREVVFGSLWLSASALQAILGALGQTDGMAVIQATIAYLNQLAASDRDKATALAGFINEDPMLVCSLGLEPQGMSIPMPWRVIRSYGNEYIDTGYVITSNNTSAKLRCSYMGDNGGANVFFGHSENNNVRYAFWCGSNRSYLNVGQVNNQQLSFTPSDIINKEISLITENGSATIAIEGLGSATYSYGGTVAGSRSSYLMAYHEAGNTTWKTKLRVAAYQLADDGTAVREMYPFIRKVNNVATLGMIDVLHDVLYTNAGSGQFTEEYGYMQNGQWVTWTPSTP